jgi:hypothetical protein
MAFFGSSEVATQCPQRRFSGSICLWVVGQHHRRHGRPGVDHLGAARVHKVEHGAEDPRHDHLVAAELHQGADVQVAAVRPVAPILSEQHGERVAVQRAELAERGQPRAADHENHVAGFLGPGEGQHRLLPVEIDGHVRRRRVLRLYIYFRRRLGGARRSRGRGRTVIKKHQP